MATAFESFTFTPKYTTFIPYSEPPKSRRTRVYAPQQAEPVAGEWIDIDQLRAPTPEVGSSQHPVVIDDCASQHKDDDELEKSSEETELRGGQSDPPIDGLPGVVHAQARCASAGSIVSSATQHPEHLEDRNFIDGDYDTNLGVGRTGESELRGHMFETRQQRWCYSPSAFPATQTTDEGPQPIQEQQDRGLKSAERRQPRSPLDKVCVPDCYQSPSLASPSSPIVAGPEITNSRDESFIGDSSNGTNFGADMTHGNECGIDNVASDDPDHCMGQHDAAERSQPGRDSPPALSVNQSHNHQEGSGTPHPTETPNVQMDQLGNEVIASGEPCDVSENRFPRHSSFGAAGGTTRQPAPVSHLMSEEFAADSEFHQADSEDETASEDEQYKLDRAKRMHQYRLSSSTTGKPAPFIRRPRSPAIRCRKSRRAVALERSPKIIKPAASRVRDGSLSAYAPSRTATAVRTRALPTRCKSESRSRKQPAAPLKLSQMTLREPLSGESFLAVVVTDDRDVASFAFDQTMTLIRHTLGDARRVESVAVMPLSLNSWLLTGYLQPHLNAVETSLDTAAPSQVDGFSSGSETDSDVDLGGTRILRSKACTAKSSPLASNKRSREGGDASANDSSDPNRFSDRSSYVEDETDDPEPAVKRRRRLWEGPEEEFLRECVKRNEPWKEIGKQLAHIRDRSEIDFDAYVPQPTYDEDDGLAPPHKYYASQKTLGRLYRAIDEHKIWYEDVRSQIGTGESAFWDAFMQRVTQRCNYLGFGPIAWSHRAEEAERIRAAYEDAV